MIKLSKSMVSSFFLKIIIINNNAQIKMIAIPINKPPEIGLELFLYCLFLYLMLSLSAKKTKSSVYFDKAISIFLFFPNIISCFICVIIGNSGLQFNTNSLLFCSILHSTF